FHSGANFFARVLRAPVGVVHEERAGFAEDLMENVERRSDGQPAIAGGGLHVDLFEGSGVKNFSIGDAIERYAACKARGALARARVQGAKHREERLFEAGLKSRREVAMPLLDGLLGTARGAEARGHALRSEGRRVGKEG